MSLANLASPSMMGVMGCVSPDTVYPMSVIFDLKYSVLRASLSRSSVESEINSNTLILAATKGGGRVLENR